MKFNLCEFPVHLVLKGYQRVHERQCLTRTRQYFPRTYFHCWGKSAPFRFSQRCSKDTCRMLTGTQHKRIFSLVLEMTKCSCCTCLTTRFGLIRIFECFLCSWDTRAKIDPEQSIQAHDREILAVSFSPASDHLIITGSADKVTEWKTCSFDQADGTLECNRPLPFTTFVYQRRNSTYSNLIQMKCFTLHGRRTTLLSLPQLRATVVSIFGTCL